MLLAILLLASCTKTLASGTVTGKDYSPPSDTLIPQYMTVCTGTPMVCTQQLTGFMPIHTNASWKLHLRNGGDTGDHNVSEADFDKYNVGDHFP